MTIGSPKRVEVEDPAGFLLHCECGAMTGMEFAGLGDGSRFRAALRKRGWFLAVGKVDGALVMDPLCGACSRRKMPEVVAELEKREREASRGQ